jgi:hypothetical protein
MRRVSEILRLKYEGGATERAIARSLGIARSTVALTLERAAAAKLSWPLPATLTDRVLEAMLYASAGAAQGGRRKAEPDWTPVHRELRRPGVTLMLLWKNIARPSRGVIATAVGASCTGPGRVACRRRCARTIPLARACSSTMPARRSS